MTTDRGWALTVGLALLVVATVTLPACGGAVRLYDESRSKMATGIRDKYTKADVLSAIEVEKKNLDKLLAEELKVVRENQRLRIDFALLRIADDRTPMAEWQIAVTNRIKALGFASVAALRQHRLAAVDSRIVNRRLELLARDIKLRTNESPPPCLRIPAPEPAAELSVPGSLAPETQAFVRRSYARYLEECKKLRGETTALAGELHESLTEWESAYEEVARLDGSIADARKGVEQKTKEYNDAEAKGQATEELRKRLESARRALEKAKDLLNLVETKNAATKNVDALVTLLTAAAGGKTDTASDPKLEHAASVARQLPSLAEDITALIEKKQAPSVNNLLIEMRHQILLLEHVKQRRGFAQQRADLLMERFERLQGETALWLRFADAMCSYAVVKGGKGFPGSRCDTFDVKMEANEEDPAASAVTCRVRLPVDKVETEVDLSPCPLEQPWRATLKDRADPEASRELYKALAAYLQVLNLEGAGYEGTFQLIDVTHRESLASRESALRQWDNLVAVPIAQLDAYYQAGLKPAEIADLLVKALGFAAITVGVSR